jgi:serine/threonine protein kinase
MATDVRIGRYVLGEKIGEGGMAVVHAAYDPQLDREVAIKLLREDGIDLGGEERSRARLVREAQALARLRHPNVVAIHEVGIHQSGVFIVMELVDGGSIDQWLGETPRPWTEVLRMYFHAGRGLAAAHEVGLAHRDFKPSNVLIGSDMRPLVVDFGLARPAPVLTTALSPASEQVTLGEQTTVQLVGSGPDAASDVTISGVVLGTPAYMAPELHEGGVADLRADQFSFCVALYEGVYHERPFSGTTLAEVSREIESWAIRPEPSATRVPGWLRNILLRGLAYDPEDRYPSMKALLAAIAFTAEIMRG